VIDSGEHFLFAAHYLTIDGPNRFLAMTGLGAMGQSLGVAYGVARAKPDRRVCVIMGDGGFSMIGLEVADAVKAGLALTVVVMNDRSLRMCELGHQRVYGRSPAFELPELDVGQVARGAGAESLRVEHTGDLLEARARFGATRPLVVDAWIDRTVLIPKKDRIGAMGEHSRAGKPG
jgi:acetolactate synthase-1/2/3 large subunit